MSFHSHQTNKPRSRPDPWTIVLVVLFLLVCVGSLITVLGKAQEGGTAFVRWMSDTERLLAGRPIYDEEHEGYPHLPATALLLVPFHALGPIVGSIAWLLVKAGALACILWAADAAARGGGRRLPGWMLPAVLVMNVRFLSGDLTHGNLNLIIGGLVALALVCVVRRHDVWAGLSLGAAVVLKITPLLFLPYLVYKRWWRALLGAVVGIVVLGWLLPSCVLGFRAHADLTTGWYRQMVHPYVSGTSVGYMQTRYENQSLTGVFYRLLSDSKAVSASSKWGNEEVRINVLALDRSTVAWLLRAAYAALILSVGWFARVPRTDRGNLGYLGEFAMVFMAMLLISERSWKHHYVLLLFGHVLILRYVTAWRPGGRRRWIPLSCLVASLICHTLFGGRLLGRDGANMAEAYGVYVAGAVFLLVGCAFVLATLRREHWPACPGRADDP